MTETCRAPHAAAVLTPQQEQASAYRRSADRDAIDRDYAMLYEELRVLARRHLRNNRTGHTLCTTGLVNESYLRLAGLQGSQWRTRGEFLALASRAMRHILVDYARTRNAMKRGGGAVQVPLHTEIAQVDEPVVDLLGLHEALARLGERSPRLEQIVENKVFGGLTNSEIAEALGTSVRTVERDWTRARAYLHQILMVEHG
jgi:RNA polymerase sigma-70 factor, ECF subfamily